MRRDRERPPTAVRDLLAALLGFLKKAFRFVSQVVFCFSRDNCAMVAGAMSFFGLISIFPLSLLAISLLTRILGSSQAAEEEVARFLRLFIPDLAKSLMAQIHYIAHHTSHRLTETLGLLGLFWAGSRVFDCLERALNHSWDVPRQRSFFSRKLVAASTFLVASALLGASIVVSAAFATISRMDILAGRLSPRDIPWLWSDLSLILPWLMSLLMFFLIYRFLPTTQVPTRLAFGSAILATVFWEASKVVFTHFIARSEVYGWVYGPLTGTVLIMIWIYLSSMILLLGAEVTYVWQQWKERTRTSAADGIPPAEPQQPEPLR